MSSLSAGPSWAETSVRWLESYHPHYVYGAKAVPAQERLEKALRKMTYRGTHGDHNDDVWETLSGPATNLAYRELAAEWSGAHHQVMTEWIKAGGYAVWKAHRDKHRSTMPAFSFGTPEGTETIELEMPGDVGELTTGDVDAAIAMLQGRAEARKEKAAPPPARQDDPTGELELEEILKAEGTNYGTW